MGPQKEPIVCCQKQLAAGVSIQLIAPASGALAPKRTLYEWRYSVSIQLIAPASGAYRTHTRKGYLVTRVSIQLIAPASGA